MAAQTHSHHEMASVRETLESIWVAIILAFVLRAFVLEAFVIPTGSMAPRLMGQHVEAICPDCHTKFPFGIQESFSGGLNPVCPNCGEQARYLAKDVPATRGRPAGKAPISFSGDRVLVLKYLYDLNAPRRWDVVVFRNPQTNRENYIKRLIGLPGEVVRIIHGDIYTHAIEDLNGDGVLDDLDVDTNGDGVFDGRDDFSKLTWKVARKDASTQLGMWQMLFDNDFPPDRSRLASRTYAWRERWTTDEGPSAWDLSVNGTRVFRYDGSAEQSAWFARHEDDRRLFLAENAYNDGDGNQSLLDRRTDFCSDVKLQAMLLPQESQGRLGLALTNFEHEWLGEVSFDGTARLGHRLINPATGLPLGGDAGQWRWSEAKIKPLKAGRAVPVAIEHADWHVKLWVDGRAVLESGDDYAPDVEELIARLKAAGRVPIPVPRMRFIGQTGQFELWHIQVLRDEFYTCPDLSQSDFRPEYAGETYGGRIMKQLLGEYRDGIPGWGTVDRPLVLRRYGDGREDLDEFFMLGDNSPASLDSRLWWRAAPTLRLYADANRTQPQYRLGTVPRYGLIGKAFFVYWPAGRPLPGLNRLPILPNVGKMRWIR